DWLPVAIHVPDGRSHSACEGRGVGDNSRLLGAGQLIEDFDKRWCEVCVGAGGGHFVTGRQDVVVPEDEWMVCIVRGGNRSDQVAVVPVVRSCAHRKVGNFSRWDSFIVPSTPFWIRHGLNELVRGVEGELIKTVGSYL